MLSYFCNGQRSTCGIEKVHIKAIQSHPAGSAETILLASPLVVFAFLDKAEVSPSFLRLRLLLFTTFSGRFSPSENTSKGKS